jgi:hypothetical protein
MRRWAAAAAFLLVACSQSTQPVAHTTATVSPSPIPSQSPADVTPDASPSPIPSQPPFTDLPLGFPTFICRLPISTPDGQGAFIAVGSSGAVTFIPQAAGVHYYDRGFSKWLPVAREAVSPDGAHYAYAEIGTNSDFFVHVVDVATGKDHAFHELTSATGFSAFPVVLNFAKEGVYLVQAFEHMGAGLWLVNPTTGSVRQVSSTIVPIAVTPGVVWAQVLNPADPKPIDTQSSSGTLPNEIDRFDLATGTQTVWLYRPATGLGIIGFDIGGHPVITSFHGGFAQINDPEAEVLIAPKPDSSRSIYKGQLARTLGGGIADEHGIWFGSDRGIYLYTNGLQKISNQPGFPANGCF